jgi:hypothetical protein
MLAAINETLLVVQKRQGLLLLMIQPADQGGKKYSQEEHVNHGGRVYLIDRDSVSRSRWAELWDITREVWRRPKEAPETDARLRERKKVQRHEPLICNVWSAPDLQAARS